MAAQLTTFERRTAIYNAVCDLQGEQVDSATALASIRQSFPDVTDEEFMRAAEAFSRVSSILYARTKAGEDIFTPEVRREVDAIVGVYASRVRVKERAMGEQWPTLREIVGAAVGILIILSAAIGVIFLAQSLGASGRLLLAIGGITSLVAALVIRGALR